LRDVAPQTKAADGIGVVAPDQSRHGAAGWAMSRFEFDFIESWRQRCPVRPPVVLGIGDDATVLSPTPTASLVTVDLLMEGTDFRWPEATATQIGRKALAVNLSDIAAMGGRPTAAWVAVALPQDRGQAFADELMTGLVALADAHQVTIAGGDTNTWRGPLVISATVWGEPVGPTPILRSGSRPGDWIGVTGALGGSLLGRHLTFEPRLAEAVQLVRLGPPSAMIDLSDGLAADLHHLLAASGVGAVVDADRLPIHPDAIISPPDKSPLQRALGDGEDFELLWTAPRAIAERIFAGWSGPTPLHRIGEVTAAEGCWLRGPDGSCQPLPPMGWVHRVDQDH
jgi:thiamine-monophosphate kinase